MPPPNITGKLHSGHALFLTIQDSLNRFYRACGHDSLWIPGLDHAGLATHEKIIEYQILRNEDNYINDINKTISYEQAAKFIEEKHKTIIIEQIKKIGALPDWEYLSYTMDESYQKFTKMIFNLLLEDNKIYFRDGQYYLDIKDLAKELLEDIEKGQIKIIPEKETSQLIHFLLHIEDWCISRQIPWGIKMPCHYSMIEDKILYDDNPSHEHSLDTWFNSSLWPIACLLKNPDLIKDFYPASLIETGADILFFWCGKMLMMGNYIYKNQHRLNLEIPSKYPFYTIYLHGLIRDKQNKKFSKSLGNGIDPLDMIKKYGADAFRLFLMTRTGPAEDMKFNENDLPGYKKFMNKIWQSARFFSIYAEKFELEKLPIELKILIENEKLKEIEENFMNHMNAFHFLEAARLIQHEFKDWFCDQWIEENKANIQSGDKAKIIEGLLILKKMLTMLHIFCPFITHAIAKDLYKMSDKTS